MVGDEQATAVQAHKTQPASDLHVHIFLDMYDLPSHVVLAVLVVRFSSSSTSTRKILLLPTQG